MSLWPVSVTSSCAITPRRTRLLRAASLRTLRRTLVELACRGAPLEARDRLIVVPTRAAAVHLARGIDRAAGGTGPVVLPDLATSRELVERFAARLPFDRPLLTAADREVLLGVACRTARDEGFEPPFRLRPAIVAEMLRFYDRLRWHRRDVDTFERLVLGRLEPGSDIDRGAERLVRQTRFLVAAFRAFEARCAEAGASEHDLRARVLAEPAPRPIGHVVVAVSDEAFDRHGLRAADWDLLARVPGLEQLDVVVTDTALAGAPHERMHALLPGIEEVRIPADGELLPELVTATGGAPVHVWRDREEEIAGFARHVKRASGRGALAPERAALVVGQPLPYVYLARETFRSGGIPCQMHDALPLAAEPYVAALDLVCDAVSSAFARTASVALLRSPCFDVAASVTPGSGTDAGPAAAAEDVVALDRALSEWGYLGGLEALERVLEQWRTDASATRLARARRAGTVLLGVARELDPLRSPAPAADHLSRLARFLASHDRPPAPDDPLEARHLRARGAVAGLLHALRDAHARFDAEPVGFDTIVPLVRRWIEDRTFAPRTGDGGVHVVDQDSARFGDFDVVQLAGLVDGEWPDRPRRNVFYAPDMLRELGWPAESERQAAARARFAELLHLASRSVMVSTFSLEADVIVSPSSLLDEVEAAGLVMREEAAPTARVFEHEALGLDPVRLDHLDPVARRWADARLAIGGGHAPARRGQTSPPAPGAWSLTALERYQDCPFAFFAADVLRLEQAPDDGSVFSPRARGRFVHEVVQRFFTMWDARGGGPITPSRLDGARAVFAEVAEALLTRLPASDAALERARLFGSAVSTGVMDVLLGLEASRAGAVDERWLEHRLDGRYALGSGTRDPVALRGVADRIDLLPGRRLRVIDYKTGQAPHPARALQVPIYALCAAEALEARDGVPWTVDEASYVRLGSPRPLVPVVAQDGRRAPDALDSARARLHGVLDGIGRGDFAPRPFDAAMCTRCAFSTVCRKEYVEHE